MERDAWADSSGREGGRDDGERGGEEVGEADEVKGRRAVVEVERMVSSPLDLSSSFLGSSFEAAAELAACSAAAAASEGWPGSVSELEPRPAGSRVAGVGSWAGFLTELAPPREMPA